MIKRLRCLTSKLTFAFIGLHGDYPVANRNVSDDVSRRQWAAGASNMLVKLINNMLIKWVRLWQFHLKSWPLFRQFRQSWKCLFVWMGHIKRVVRFDISVDHQTIWSFWTVWTAFNTWWTQQTLVIVCSMQINAGNVRRELLISRLLGRQLTETAV